jgi:hypothetical protein
LLQDTEKIYGPIHEQIHHIPSGLLEAGTMNHKEGIIRTRPSTSFLNETGTHLTPEWGHFCFFKDGFSKMIPISSGKNRCQAAKRSGAAAAKACKEAKKNLPQFPRIHWVSGWKISKSDPRYIDFSSSHE